MLIYRLNLEEVPHDFRYASGFGYHRPYRGLHDQIAVEEPRQGRVLLVSQRQALLRAL